MSARLLLRASSGPRVGMGHAMRTWAVARALRARGARPVLVVDDACTARAFAAAGRELDRGAIEVRGDGASDAWLRRDARAAWLDGRVDWSAELDELGRRGVRTFVVENRTPARERADFVVYPALHWRADGWDAAHPARVLGGARWIPLAPEVERARPAVRDVGLLVTFGGSDPLGSTERVLGLLRTGEPVVAVLGPHMLARRAAIERAGRHLRHVSVVRPEGSLAPWMARSRRALTALGTTLYELAHLGVPAAILANYEDDGPALAHYAAHGPHLALGPAPELSDRELAERLQRFVELPPPPCDVAVAGGAARLAARLLEPEDTRKTA